MTECKHPSSPGLRDPILKLLLIYVIDDFILMEIFLERRGLV